MSDFNKRISSESSNLQIVQLDEGFQPYHPPSAKSELPSETCRARGLLLHRPLRAKTSGQDGIITVLITVTVVMIKLIIITTLLNLRMKLMQMMVAITIILITNNKHTTNSKRRARSTIGVRASPDCSGHPSGDDPSAIPIIAIAIIRITNNKYIIMIVR